MEKFAALSIAGLDPCGGAGVFADIKTFEQHQIKGFGACTSITAQTEDKFFGINWFNMEEIKFQIEKLFLQYTIPFCKIGIVPSINFLEELVFFLKKQSKNINILWDPILKASAGFQILSTTDIQALPKILKEIFLITPNLLEYTFFNQHIPLKSYTNVFLKGGHNEVNLGQDILYYNQKEYIFNPIKNNNYFPKHGSGCVLSASIVAHLVLGNPLPEACEKAKNYTAQFLSSNKELLGKHFTTFI